MNVKNNIETDVTISRLLTYATDKLSTLHDTARLDAELLLMHALEVERSYLYTWPNKQVTEDQAQVFESLLEQRLKGVPIAHLTGVREFWSLPLTVSADTLIPRPDTETLVETALNLIPAVADWRIADLGTGSGAIGLAIARERPRCRVIATDSSPDALIMAQENARQLDIDNIRFVEGHWFAPLAEQYFHMIVSNPPYIRMDDPHLQRGDVRFEPYTALAAGHDGLDSLRHIISHAADHLLPPGYLLLEHGYDQADAVASLLEQQGYSDIACIHDTAGQPRVTRAHL